MVEHHSDRMPQDQSVLKSGLITYGLPAALAITLVARWAMSPTRLAGEPVFFSPLTRLNIDTIFKMYVVQLAVLSVLAGINLRRHFAWWLIFVWGVVLTDLQVAYGPSWDIRPSYSDDHDYASAFLVAQMAALIGVGTTLQRASVASPLVLVGTVWTCSLARWNADEMIIIQMFVGACWGLLLRARSVRLAACDASPLDPHNWQFSIKWMLWWVTCIAVILTLVSPVSGRWLPWYFPVPDRLMERIIAAMSLTYVTSVVGWALLGGTKWPVFRLTLVLTLHPLNRLFATLMLISRPVSVNHPPRQVHESVDAWIVWVGYMIAFLCAFLLVLVVSGYRLQLATRKRPKRGSERDDGSTFPGVLTKPR